jgi:hypothetical protein
VTLTLGRVWVQDLDDFIAITTSGGDVFDAPGNIGDGTLNRVTLEWTTPLGWLGLRNATLDGFLEWFDTDVIDPVTGVERSWSGHRGMGRLVLISARPSPSASSPGAGTITISATAPCSAPASSVIPSHPDGDLDVYVETTRWFDLTTRLGADFILDTTDKQDRILYDGPRSDGVESLHQQRYFENGPQIFLSVRGAF